MPNAEILTNVGAELSYQLPEAYEECFETMMASLEVQRDILGIQSISISGTTLEEVFLKVGQLSKAEIEHDITEGTKKYGFNFLEK